MFSSKYLPTHVQLLTHVATSGARGAARLEVLAESACQDHTRRIRVNRVVPALRHQGIVDNLPREHTVP